MVLVDVSRIMFVISGGSGVIRDVVSFWMWALVHPFSWCVIGFLIVYSFVINTIFGHPSYWRSKNSFLVPMYRNIRKKIVHYWRGECLVEPLCTDNQDSHSAASIEHLDDNALLYCCTFLTPADALVLGCTSSAWKGLCNDKYLWQFYLDNLFNQTATQLHISLPLSLRKTLYADNRRNFFASFDAVLTYLLYAHDIDDESLRDSAEVCRVLIDGSVYDLSGFVHNHAGGEHILLEWKGKDATRQFLIGNHSLFATKRSESMIMWKAVSFLGKRGSPAMMISNRK